MNKPKRSMYCITPEIFDMHELSWTDTMLINEIDRNDFGTGCCKDYEYLKDFMGYQNLQTLTNAIYRLRQNGYIKKDKLSIIIK